MPTPTVTDPTTRPAMGLTTKGRATAVLIRVRDQWERLTPEQQVECSAILERLSVALRAESKTHAGVSSAPRPLPLVGRICA